MTCVFVQLATLKFNPRQQICIRMGITIFKIFIWGGISSDMRSQNCFTAPLACRRKTIFPIVFHVVSLFLHILPGDNLNSTENVAQVLKYSYSFTGFLVTIWRQL